MKIKDLKQPYRALAEMRREQQINSEWVKRYQQHYEINEDMGHAFEWKQTKEGNSWWYDTIEGEYPEIPAASLEELKEWQKEHPEYEATVISEQPNDKLFQAAVAAMQGLLSTNLFLVDEAERIAQMSWEQAEALINEGKKRGHL